MFKRRLRFFLHRWHRRVGLTAAFIIVLVSLTGVMLNHTGELSLAKTYPQSGVWLWPYEVVARSGYQQGNDFVYAVQQQAFLNEQVLLNCTPPLLGVARQGDELWVLCSAQLLLLKDQQLIESTDTSLLGENIHGIGTLGPDIVLRNHDAWQRLDGDALVLTTSVAGPDFVLTPQGLPAAYQQNHDISWQKVLQDLHSGRFFGHWGIYVVDAAALILLLLALSGFWIWYSRR